MKTVYFPRNDVLLLLLTPPVKISAGSLQTYPDAASTDLASLSVRWPDAEKPGARDHVSLVAEPLDAASSYGLFADRDVARHCAAGRGVASYDVEVRDAEGGDVAGRRVAGRDVARRAGRCLPGRCITGDRAHCSAPARSVRRNGLRQRGVRQRGLRQVRRREIRRRGI